MKTDDAKAAASAITQLAQATLDLPKLQPYYHAAELPERSPLIVVGDAFRDVLGPLTSFGKPVVMKRESELQRGEPVFRFTRIERQGEGAQVEFEYTPEGIRGQAVLALRGTSWEATSFSLVEK
jgi:hypothetical protein